MEAHYTTITEKKLQDIRRILGEKQEIKFEMGFESADEDVREIYNKDIDLEKYLEIIAVLFPINIKKNTMLKHWQDIGVYDQISSWEFVELLHKIPEKYLDKFTIAWWGSRE